MNRSRDLIFLMAVALLFVIAARLGVPRLLGAHPFWADRVVFIGLLVGALPALAVRVWVPRGALWPVLAVVLMSCAATISVVGKARFVASYADDRSAGTMWYLGWIGAVALAFVCLAFVMRETAGDRE